MARGIILFLLLCLSIEEAHADFDDTVKFLGVSGNFARLTVKLNQQVQSYYNLELAFNAYSSFYDRADIALPGFSEFFKKSSKHMRDKALSLTRLINIRGGWCGGNPALSVKGVCRDIGDYFKNTSLTSQTSQTNRNIPFICHSLHPYEKKHSKSVTWAKWLKYVFGITIPGNALEEKDEMNHVHHQSGLYGLEDALAAEKSLIDKIYDLISTAKKYGDVHVKHFLEHNMLELHRIKSIGDLVGRLRGFSKEEYHLQEYMMDLELNS